MRPLVLKMTGLRSYRTETTVDFSDVSLLAIIGATGSGKSSLLEAITYALYGNATWEKRNAALIADGALRMTVSLTFQADEQQWQITRSAPHPSKSYPAASQELLCLSDPTKPRIDGSGEVRARIGELIGLDYEGFKSCVLLPQGRFDQLLKSTAAERVRILKAILGLEALDDMRGRAQQLTELLSARVEEILRARNQFLADPQATHDLADAEIARLTPRAQALEQVQQRAQALVEEVRAQDDVEKAATAAANRIDELTDAGALERLRPLQQLQAQLGRVHSAAAVAVRNAERDADTAAAAARTAAEQDRSVVAITRIRGTLQATSAALRTIACDRITVNDRQVALAEDRRRLDATRDLAAQLERTLRERAEAEEAAETVAREARDAAATTIAAIEAIVSARDQLNAAEDAASTAQRIGEQAQQQEVTTHSAHESAETALATAQAAVDTARLAQAAAHAAHGCKPGDSCPVCTRTLPATFTAPHLSADVAALSAQLTDAQKVERDAFAAATRAKAATGTAVQQLSAATAGHELASTAWRSVANTALPGGLLAATVLADEATRELVQGPGALADRQLQAARQARVATADEHRAAAASAAASEIDIERRHRELGEAAADYDRREQSERGRLKLLPGWADIPETAGADEFDACDERLSAALVQAEQREQHAASTATLVRGCEQALNDASQRIRDEVDGPAVNECNALRALAAEANRHRTESLPEAPAAPESIAELISAAERIVTGARDTLLALQTSAVRARETASDKQRQGAELVASAGFQTSAKLHDAVIDLLAGLRAATAQREAAAAQIAPVARLDALLAQAGHMRAGLRELAFQLGDGKFTGYVVAQRQQALLALSSGIFREITAGQYGFTEDFKIVDRLTGTARTPETLSGGETFLASLALALGLVELAGRSGGRLQALFLDEGFGSLDPDALDHALSELERRAAAGRLIAMISHVPAIAERIEQVLQVTKTPQGSRVQLLSVEQRAALLLDDVREQAAVVT